MTTIDTSASGTSASADVQTLLNPATQPGRVVTATVGQSATDALASTLTQTGNTQLFDAATKTLGKQDFLYLLVTQLQYQDPLQPTDNTQFVSQLAQFSALEGTQNVQKSIDDLGTKMDSMVTAQQQSSGAVTNASATSLLGKDARMKLPTLDWDPAQKTVDFNVHTDAGSNSLLSFVDSKGNIVAAFKPQNDGDSAVSWNGMASDGTPLPKGTYTLMVTPPNDGSVDSGYAYVEGKVSGLNFATDGLHLQVGGMDVPMSQVVQISDPATTN